jgi:hypothetical protein
VGSKLRLMKEKCFLGIIGTITNMGIDKLTYLIFLIFLFSCESKEIKDSARNMHVKLTFSSEAFYGDSLRLNGGYRDPLLLPSHDAFLTIDFNVRKEPYDWMIDSVNPCISTFNLYVGRIILYGKKDSLLYNFRINKDYTLYGRIDSKSLYNISYLKHVSKNRHEFIDRLDSIDRISILGCNDEIYFSGKFQKNYEFNLYDTTLTY